MRAWRIARSRFALDRSGAGGLVDAGRWHPLGVPVIYAGLSVEICALEKLVHTGRILPPDLQLVRLDLPDDPGLYEHLDPARVPNWADTPPGAAWSPLAGLSCASSAVWRWSCPRRWCRKRAIWSSIHCTRGLPR